MSVVAFWISMQEGCFTFITIRLSQCFLLYPFLRQRLILPDESDKVRPCLNPVPSELLYSSSAVICRHVSGPHDTIGSYFISKGAAVKADVSRSREPYNKVALLSEMHIGEQGFCSRAAAPHPYFHCEETYGHLISSLGC